MTLATGPSRRGDRPGGLKIGRGSSRPLSNDWGSGNRQRFRFPDRLAVAYGPTIAGHQGWSAAGTLGRSLSGWPHWYSTCVASTSSVVGSNLRTDGHLTRHLPAGGLDLARLFTFRRRPVRWSRTRDMLAAGHPMVEIGAALGISAATVCRRAQAEAW